MVEGGEIKGLHRFRRPQAQPIAGADPKPKDGRVVGDALDNRFRYPAATQLTLRVGRCFGMPTETDIVGQFGARNFPRIAEVQPFVGDLHLPAVLDRLIEDAKLVTDAITHGGDLQRSQGILVTRSQSAQATVTQARFLFLFNQLSQINPQFRHGFAGLLGDPQIQQVIG